MRVIAGGLGYRNLRDHSFGIALTERLLERSWPAAVSVEDLSYNPIALMQRLQGEPEPFDRAVIAAAVARPGRAPGEIEAYRWDGALPSPESIQTAVTEAVTGVIALDNTLVIARHFGGLPGEVAVVEVQPEAEEFGDAFTEAVAAALEPACRLVAGLATEPEALRRLAEAPLGAGRLVRAAKP